MVVYADVLIFVNAVIDYIILNIVSLIIKKESSVVRIVAAAVLGGFSSLYIFVENTALPVDILFKVAVTALMVFITFGFGSTGRFTLALSVMLGIAFIINGAFVFLQNIIDREIVFSDNMMNYINISPIFLISTFSNICFIFSSSAKSS